MATRSPASEAVLAVVLEFLAVAVFTLMAGAGEEGGNVAVLFMVGFWLIFLVSESGIVKALGNTLQAYISNPSNK